MCNNVKSCSWCCAVLVRIAETDLILYSAFFNLIKVNESFCCKASSEESLLITSEIVSHYKATKVIESGSPVAGRLQSTNILEYVL